MSIPNHLETTEVVLLEVEILFTIIATGARGGFVSYLIRRDRQEGDDHSHKGIMHCLTRWWFPVLPVFAQRCSD